VEKNFAAETDRQREEQEQQFKALSVRGGQTERERE
jgi:hypothetical protein